MINAGAHLNAGVLMICTERGSKLVSAANYTVMSRHQSYDVLSCSTMPSLLVMAIAYLSCSLSSSHPTSNVSPSRGVQMGLCT